MARLSPYIFSQEFDNNGNPLSGGLIYTYEAGTTTPKVTYSDSDGTIANSNPIVLDSAGRYVAWLASGAYKFVLKTSAGVTIETKDNIAGDTSNAFGSSVVSISGNLSITSAYRNNVIVATAAATLSLLPVASATDGFYFVIKNDSTSANVTVDPNAAELIDGVATVTIRPKQTAICICNGTSWNTLFLNSLSIYADSIQTSGASGVVLKNSAGTTALTVGSSAGVASVFAGDISTTGNISAANLFLHGQCRLSLSGANLLLSQYNGQYLIINGVPQVVPNAGVSLAPTGAAATTTYYIYAYMSGSTMTLEFSATGHSRHTNGIEIKTGDATRTLVGMAYASALNTWGTGSADVANWFNRRNITVSGSFSTARSTSSTSMVEINSEIRCNFLSWNDETVSCNTNQAVSNGGANNLVTTQLSIDGSTDIGGSTFMQPTTFLPAPVSVADNVSVSEGRHYLTVKGDVSAGTGTWYPSTTYLGSSKTTATVRI